MVLGTGFGALESSVAFDQQALLKGPNTVNPMDFPNTVANAAGSRIGIWLQLKGPNVTLTNGGTSLLDALGFAWEGLNSGLFQRCLVGAAEKIPNFLRASAPVGDGAILFLGTGEESGGTSFGVEDFLSIQWKRDGTIPLPFRSRLDDFWGGVEWAALPEGSPWVHSFRMEFHVGPPAIPPGSRAWEGGRHWRIFYPQAGLPVLSLRWRPRSAG